MTPTHLALLRDLLRDGPRNRDRWNGRMRKPLEGLERSGYIKSTPIPKPADWKYQWDDVTYELTDKGRAAIKTNEDVVPLKSFKEFITESVNKVLSGHTSQETAYVIDDYPYGFRLRCKMRYWIETNKNGSRVVSQTTNPKVPGEVWNKPKASTYSNLRVLFIDEQGHVQNDGLGIWAGLDKIATFEATYGEGLKSERDQKELKLLKAAEAAMAARRAKAAGPVTEAAEDRAARRAAFQAAIDAACARPLGPPPCPQCAKTLTLDDTKSPARFTCADCGKTWLWNAKALQR